MEKEYLLFDLDGTLTDPKEGITKSVRHALKAYNIEVEDLDTLCCFIGPPLKDSFIEYYGFSEEDAVNAIGVYREYFSDRGIFENEVYEGIEEMLKALTSSGKKLLWLPRSLRSLSERSWSISDWIRISPLWAAPI